MVTQRSEIASLFCVRGSVIFLFRIKNKPARRQGEIIYKQRDLLMTESGFLSMGIFRTRSIQEPLPGMVNAWFLSGSPSL